MMNAKLLISGALLLFSFDSALACSCGRNSNAPLDWLRGSRAVFAGEVVSVGAPRLIRVRNSRGKMYLLGARVEVKFKVSRAWKGVDADTIVVETVDATNSCYVEYKVGGKYLVYAYGKRLHIDYCSRILRLEDAAEDLRELGEGSVISQTRSRTSR